MAKLWQKNYQLDELMEQFTVGLDYELDLALVVSDCAASIAHARGLRTSEFLSQKELEDLERELAQIARDARSGAFRIARSDEDCHTAIENRLVERLGDAGKRIHTGRSRNDQSLTMIRLFGKEALLEIRSALTSLVGTLVDFASRHEKVPMPGRTHMQIAMPSSVGMWAAALASSLLDDIRLVEAVFALVDRSPLGTAAGYGVPIDLHREQTASAMGFAGPFRNALAAHNSRGKLESACLDALEQVMISLSKYATDLLFFSLPEIRYFSLPDRLCTGSSIMPQKKNPDGLELIRSRAGMVGGWAAQAKNVVRSLPTGYNRDFQDTKEPWLRGLSTALTSVRVMQLTFEGLQVNREKLLAAFGPEIYATDAALARVLSGEAFRDAYLYVGTHLEELGAIDPTENLSSRREPGSAGNLYLHELSAALDECRSRCELDFDKHRGAMENLLGAGNASLLPSTW